MEITLNDDEIKSKPLPNRPFLARFQSTTGPLCLVIEHVGHGSHRFRCLFLQGHGAPAIWDEWMNMTIEKVAENFIPLTSSITLKNTWPT